MKKAFTILLSILMVALMIPAMAYADPEPTPANVAQIGDTGYPTLADAVAAVQDEKETTIIMIGNEAVDVAGVDGVTISKDKKIVLDLNGKEIAGVCSTGKGSNLLTNYGTLTIMDSSDAEKNGTGTGKMTYGATPSWEYDGTISGSYASNLINNRGTLTIESGYYLNDATGAACYVVDNYANGQAATFTLNGGKLVNTHYSAVRFALSTDYLCKAVMKSGIIESLYSSVINYNNASNPKADIKYCGTVTKGTETSLYESSSSTSGVASFEDVKLLIESGKFSGSEGAIAWLESLEKFVTGGYFSNDVSKYVADGYECVSNTDTLTNGEYPFIVKAKTPVAQIGSKTYLSLSDAVNAAVNGDTIKMIADEKLKARVEINKKIILDLNGKTIEADPSLKSKEFAPIDVYPYGYITGVIAVNHGGDLTIDDNSQGKEGKILANGKTYSAVILTVETNDANKAILTLKNGTLIGDYYGIVGNGSLNRGNTEININGGKVSGSHENDSLGIYNPQEKSVVNVSGGEIEGYSSGIEMRSGVLNVTGGKITASAENFSETASGSGNTIVGAAIALSQHNTNNELSATISGGEFSGKKAFYEVDLQDGEVNNISAIVSGGKFNGEIGSENLKKFITGGYYTSNDVDTNKYVADGYQCVALASTDALYEEDYRYQVVKQNATVNESTGDITVDEKVITVIDEETNKQVDQEKAQAAADAINKVLDTPEVTNFTDTRIQEATPVNEKTTIVDVDNTTYDLSIVLNEIKKEANKTANISAAVTNDNQITITPSDKEGQTVKDANVAKDISVDLTAATIAKVSDTTTVTTMEFEVKPIATVTVTVGTGNEAVTVTAVIPNSAIVAPITFRLPVDSSVPQQYANVFHDRVFMGSYEIQTGANGKYIEVSSRTFSKFMYELFSTSDAVAGIDDARYLTLAQAIDVVENGQTIKLLKDSEAGTITVSRAISFTIDLNSKENKANIVAGAGYELVKSGNTYTFKLKEEPEIKPFNPIEFFEYNVEKYMEILAAAQQQQAIIDVQTQTGKLTEAQLKALVGDLKITVRTENQTRGIKVYVNEIPGIKAITDAGYTISYDFYNVQQKKVPTNNDYKITKIVDKTENWYLNTAAKKGKKYYYKVVVNIKDEDGNVVAQTALNQCLYGCRTRK